jgi:hypothetical protein
MFMGTIQRRIWRAFVAHPDKLFRTEELARWCYPRLNGKPQRKHRWAIVRAARKVATRVKREAKGVVFSAKRNQQQEITNVLMG